MKNCKTIIVTMMLVISFFVTTASAETKIEVTDEIDDVTDQELINVTEYPDVDIKKVTVERNNNKIDLTLELNENGTIPESGWFVYSIDLITSSENYYTASYMRYDETGTSASPSASVLLNSEEEVLDDYSINSNKILFSFNLADSYEICIGLTALTMVIDISGTSGYLDYVNAEENLSLTIDAGGKYYGKTGKNVNFKGTVTDGDASAYKWVWTIEDVAQPLTGQTASYTFLKKGNYSGILYAYNPDTGLYTQDIFTVQVNGTSINGGGDNNEPGFEIIAFISAVAIALIILRKRKR